MKRFYFLFLTVLMAATSAYAWKPIFAGHRGSYRGVMNTAEAYRNGADFYHYTGLECDVRVTKDGYYVISHDETTENICPTTLTIASSTLAELKALDLKQTRGGVTYTGKICTVEEYLDICVEKNCFPIIELKWATGINNNDMSKFPGLYALVESKGLVDKAIFLTSMNKSLEYIAVNYPKAQCQYLLSSDSDTKLEFCKKYKYNPSFSAGAITRALVERYAEAGLQVAAWTVNTEDNYKKYGEMGCYMMTCDYLRPDDMPEITVAPPGTPQEEPKDVEINVLWTKSAKEGNLPTDFPTKAGGTYTTGQQAAVVDGKFYVSDYGTKSILIFDENSTAPVVIPFSETEFGGSPMHGLCTDDAGNFIQRFESSISASPSRLRLFRYGSTVPVEVTFTLANGGQANFLSASGDVFSEEGGYVYFLPNSQYVVSVVHIANGEYKDTYVYPELSTKGSTAAVVIPIEGPDNFIYMVRNTGFYRYNKGKKTTLLTTSSTTAPSRNSSLGGAYFVIDGHEMLAHPSGTNYNGGFTIRDISTLDNDPLWNFPPLGTEGYSVNASCGTFITPVRVAEDVYHLYHYTMGNGYGVYEVKRKGALNSVATLAAESDARLTAFPNPVINVTSLQSSKPLGVVEVYGIDGRLARRADMGDVTVAQLDMSGLASGFYVAVTADGRRVKLAKR